MRSLLCAFFFLSWAGSLPVFAETFPVSIQCYEDESPFEGVMVVEQDITKWPVTSAMLPLGTKGYSLQKRRAPELSLSFKGKKYIVPPPGDVEFIMYTDSGKFCCYYGFRLVNEKGPVLDQVEINGELLFMKNPSTMLVMPPRLNIPRKEDVDLELFNKGSKRACRVLSR
jgi:hypothetical protein